MARLMIPNRAARFEKLATAVTRISDLGFWLVDYMRLVPSTQRICQQSSPSEVARIPRFVRA